MTDSHDDPSEGSPQRSNEFARMFEESLREKRRAYSVGDKIRGELLVIGKEELFFAIGQNQDVAVDRRQFLDENGELSHKVGDSVDLYVTQVRGSTILASPQKTAKNISDDLEDAFDMMLPIEGRVVEVCKGGVRVAVAGKKLAFCPLSQLDLRRVENPEEYVGKRLEFKITEFKEGGRNIVVSRRKLLEENRELEMDSDLSHAPILGAHKVGDIVTGKVTRLEKFGAFIEIAAGIDGLAHISELSWTRIAKPEEVLSVAQEVSVKILKIENQDGRVRVALSFKQAGIDPWSQVAAKFPVGTTVTGKVERREPYGIFFRITDGVTGLFPKSKAHENPEFPFEKLRVGDEVAVAIGELRIDEKRISLTAPKDPGAEDWKNYVSTQSSGSLGSLGDHLRKAMEKKAKK